MPDDSGDTFRAGCSSPFNLAKHYLTSPSSTCLLVSLSSAIDADYAESYIPKQPEVRLLDYNLYLRVRLDKLASGSFAFLPPESLGFNFEIVFVFSNYIQPSDP